MVFRDGAGSRLELHVVIGFRAGCISVVWSRDMWSRCTWCMMSGQVWLGRLTSMTRACGGSSGIIWTKRAATRAPLSWR